VYSLPYLCTGFFLRFRFGDRKEILRDRLEEFERLFSIDVISGHYILRDRWKNLRERFGPSKHLKKTLPMYNSHLLAHLAEKLLDALYKPIACILCCTFLALQTLQCIGQQD